MANGTELTKHKVFFSSKDGILTFLQNVFIWDTATFRNAGGPKKAVNSLQNCHSYWITGVIWSNTAPNLLVCIISLVINGFVCMVHHNVMYLVISLFGSVV